MSSSSNVGDVVDAYCRRCRLVLDANVAALVDDHIVSVVCRTCGERQRYKPEKPTPSSRKLRVVDMRSRPPSTRERRDTPARVPSHEGGKRQASQRRVKRLSSRPSEPSADVMRWRAATDGVDSRFARPHRSEDSYVADDLILHKAHGMGVVVGVGPNGTLDILFRHGLEKLQSTPLVENGD